VEVVLEQSGKMVMFYQVRDMLVMVETGFNMVFPEL
jgi:hypothetical protein